MIKGVPATKPMPTYRRPGKSVSYRRGRYPVGKVRLYHRPEKGARVAARGMPETVCPACKSAAACLVPPEGGNL